MHQMTLQSAIFELGREVPPPLQGVLLYYLDRHGEDGIHEFQVWWDLFALDPSSAFEASPLEVQSDVLALMQVSKGKDFQAVDDVVVRLLRIISRVLFLGPDEPINTGVVS